MFQMMFVIGFVCFALFFVLAIVSFVRNDVGHLIGDVTGINAKRAIKRISKKGAEEISKDDAIHPQTGKIMVRQEESTGTLADEEETSPLSRKQKRESRKKSMPQVEVAPEQSILDAISDMERQEKGVSPYDETEQLSLDDDGENETTVLATDITKIFLKEEFDASEFGDDYDDLTGDEETTVLHTEETEVLVSGDVETSILYEDINVVEDGMLSILDDAVEGMDSVVISGMTETTEKLMGSDAASHERHDDWSQLGAGTEASVYNASTILNGEERLLPSIFEIEDEATIVHTEDMITLE